MLSHFFNGSSRIRFSFLPGLLRLPSNLYETS